VEIPQAGASVAEHADEASEKLMARKIHDGWASESWTMRPQRDG
jgi:hypothetical protein